METVGRVNSYRKIQATLNSIKTFSLCASTSDYISSKLVKLGALMCLSRFLIWDMYVFMHTKKKMYGLLCPKTTDLHNQRTTL